MDQMDGPVEELHLDWWGGGGVLIRAGIIKDELVRNEIRNLLLVFRR